MVMEFIEEPENWGQVNYQAVIFGQQKKPTEGFHLWPDTSIRCAWFEHAYRAKTMLDPNSTTYALAQL